MGGCGITMPWHKENSSWQHGRMCAIGAAAPVCLKVNTSTGSRHRHIQPQMVWRPPQEKNWARQRRAAVIEGQLIFCLITSVQYVVCRQRIASDNACIEPRRLAGFRTETITIWEKLSKVTDWTTRVSGRYSFISFATVYRRALGMV
jgi:hypothetical protein